MFYSLLCCYLVMLASYTVWTHSRSTGRTTTYCACVTAFLASCFLLIEILQMYLMRKTYWKSGWNFMALLTFTVVLVAVVPDIPEVEVVGVDVPELAYIRGISSVLIWANL